MIADIQAVWNALRGTIREACTFSQIKEIAGAAGLPLHELAGLQQKSLPEKGASKSELLEAVDELIQKSGSPEQIIRRFVAAVVANRPHIENQIEECVQRFRWTLSEGLLRPTDLQVEEAATDFHEEVRQSLRNAHD